MTLPTVQIRGAGTCTDVMVDGVKVPGLAGAHVYMVPGKLAQVELVLGARPDIEIVGADIHLEGVKLPEALEHALLAHLAEKYPMSAALQNIMARWVKPEGAAVAPAEG